MTKTSAIEVIPTAMVGFQPSLHSSSHEREGRRSHSTGNLNFHSSPNPPSQLAAMTVNSIHSQTSNENTNNFWLSQPIQQL